MFKEGLLGSREYLLEVGCELFVICEMFISFVIDKFGDVKFRVKLELRSQSDRRIFSRMKKKDLLRYIIAFDSILKYIMIIIKNIENIFFLL